MYIDGREKNDDSDGLQLVYWKTIVSKQLLWCDFTIQKYADSCCVFTTGQNNWSGTVGKRKANEFLTKCSYIKLTIYVEQMCLGNCFAIRCVFHTYRTMW